ncbi:N-acetyltransferase [Thomasclavelia spiroformis]|uniref:N-acetyltransferase n=1 Tax=Thomasclavelia spiroformis TaxID=29348 RepID=UPI000B395509|nr:N-acetyltransferase [Thomasclavelia spiroformis]OUO65552.1 N-acetyltransferase [Thomasclavelia spiroformis]OUQ01151.1 N-acetyltransferase [Thomasclavelia spiroformis]
MIRKFKEDDLNTVMQIWFDTNIKAHHFISRQYWIDNYEMVKDILPKKEIYVYEDDNTNQINGFIGLMDNYIAGIFVNKNNQSRGIGKQLLDYVKEIKETLNLSVYQKNIRAISFYQREQFVIQSEHIDNDNNEKEFIMIWSK